MDGVIRGPGRSALTRSIMYSDYASILGAQRGFMDFNEALRSSIVSDLLQICFQKILNWHQCDLLL